MSRVLLYGVIAVAALGFAGYSALQCFGYGLAVGGSRGVVGAETALRHYGILSGIWFWAVLLSLVICGLFIRAASRAARSPH